MTFGGLHPVVAIYSTFLNRAFDQLLLDVSLHKAGATFVLDRSGITGDDGPSHHGMWDLALTGIVPHLKVAAPRDGTRLQELLREAVTITDQPTVLRFPKGSVAVDIPAFERRDGIDLLYRGESADILVVSIGAMAAIAVEAAAQAYREGVGVTVLDPRWVKPLAPAIITMAQRYSHVVVIEDGIRHGGIGSTLAESMRDAGVEVPVHSIGIPLTFIEHAKRAEILSDLGISAQQISRSLVELRSTGELPFMAGMQRLSDETSDRSQPR
jgi:1-deoxy-D-xylulose-5-phosphate synthase